MPRPPFGHAGDDGAGLSDQCEVASGRHVGREAGVEHGGGDDHAEAVGADKPQAVRPRGLLRGGEGAVLSPAVIMIAAAAPFAPAAATVLGTAAGGTAITTMSGTSVIASMELTVDKPSMYS
jgi:hypothetical protein